MLFSKALKSLNNIEHITIINISDASITTIKIKEWNIAVLNETLYKEKENEDISPTIVEEEDEDGKIIDI